MRRLAAATVTAILSTAALTAGATAAQAAVSTPATVALTAHGHGHGGFTFQMLGQLRLKRTDTMTGETRVRYLMCMSISAHGGPITLHGYGDVKDPTAACRELAAVDGDFAKLAVHPTWLAPEIVAPVAVKATGTWEGTKVAWHHEYQNSGWLAKATGNVFEF